MCKFVGLVINNTVCHGVTKIIARQAHPSSFINFSDELGEVG